MDADKLLKILKEDVLLLSMSHFQHRATLIILYRHGKISLLTLNENF